MSFIIKENLRLLCIIVNPLLDRTKRIWSKIRKAMRNVFFSFKFNFVDKKIVLDSFKFLKIYKYNKIYSIFS